MLGSVFQLHQRVIRWVDFLICYVGHQAAPSGCLYAVMHLRHLGCDGQVAGNNSPAMIAAPVAHLLLHCTQVRSEGGLTGRCAASPLPHRWNKPATCVCLCVCACDRPFQSLSISLRAVTSEINLQSSMKCKVFLCVYVRAVQKVRLNCSLRQQICVCVCVLYSPAKLWHHS